jgi:cell wall-associated NlpC family hydrolase
MATTQKYKKTITPRDKLQISNLDTNALMANDLDVDALKLQFKKKIGIDIADRITDMSVERTIEGASTVTITIDDSDRELLQSGRLTNKPDIELDGLWFRMTGVTKTGDELELTFEDREIAVLRTYTSKLVKTRDQMNRAHFILTMIKEVQEFKIPWVIPELDDVQPVEGEVAAQYPDPNIPTIVSGIANDPNLRIGHAPGSKPTFNQIQVMNTILQVAQENLLPRKLWVIAMMVAFQESGFTNLPLALSGWNKGHAGVFQQDPRYWPASGNVKTDAEAFFLSGMPNSKWPHGSDGLVKNSIKYPNMAYSDLAEATQHAGPDYPAQVAPWRTQSENIVTAFGMPASGMDTANAQAPNYGVSSGTFHYFRGEDKIVNNKTVFKPESSWKCIQRLADDVGWRAFFVAGTFYYVSEEWLFAGPPVAVIDEDTEGIDIIDFDYQSNSKAANVTVNCRIGRWVGTPGSLIQIQNMGPINGRWIVSSVQRGFFDNLGTITLKKPRPKLVEPASSSDALSNYTGNTGQTQTQQTEDSIPNTMCAKKVVNAAMSQKGLPYQWAAEEAGVAFDCSGLTEWAYKQAGIGIGGHNSVAQWFATQNTVVRDRTKGLNGQLQAGDLVFFAHPGVFPSTTDSQSIHHVAIYIGNDQFIHAPHTGDVIKISHLFSDSYYKSEFYGATRPCPMVAADTTNQSTPTQPTPTSSKGTRKATMKNGTITWVDNGKPATGDALAAWSEQNPGKDFPKEGDVWNVPT